MSTNSKTKPQSETEVPYPFLSLPKAQGLYSPRYEHDACGLGFVANIEGHKSHDIVLKGIQILINLTHRGACGCDPETGDGAGILIQIPHTFFERECASLGFTLPSPGEYGVGMVFLPVDPQERMLCEGILEKAARAQGLTVLGWRDTPINGDTIGRVARASQPYIEQIFIRRSRGMDQDALERKLYVVRKRAEAAVAESDLKEKDFFYIPSLSSRTIVYKGLLLAPQITTLLQGALGRRTDQRDLPGTPAILDEHVSELATGAPVPLRLPQRRNQHSARQRQTGCTRGSPCWRLPCSVKTCKKLLPIITPGGSDSAMLDNAVELLTLAGRSLPHVMSMLIPEAWDHDAAMPEDVKAFYEYHASLMEPWDGPAAVAFTDGRVIGAKLDRNGLRPGRYVVTADGLVIMASEAGVLPVKPEDVRMKGRLAPGRMLLVDTEQKRLISDEEVKKHLAARQAIRQVAEGKSDHTRSSSEPDARAADGSRYDPDAPARVRLHGRGPEDDPRALGAERRRADRLDGHRHAAGVPFGQAATAVQLFQADVRAGDESRDRSDPRRFGDVAQHATSDARGTSSMRRPRTRTR